VPRVSLTNQTTRSIYAECFKRESKFGPLPAPPAPPPVSIGSRRRHVLQTSSGATAVTVTRFNASAVTCGPTDAFCYSCYCLELIATSSILREREYCSEYAAGYSMQVVAAAAAQGIIVVVNIFLKQVIARVVRYERHHSASSEQTSVMRKLFLAQFINTAVNLVVIHAAFPWVTRATEGTGVSGLTGDLKDLTPRWYTEVGYALVLSMIVNSVSQRVQTLVRHWHFQRKRTAGRQSAVTQRQLNTAYDGAEFVMSTRYGEILNVIFVTLTFSAGLPVLVPLAAVSFMVHYLVDMFEFTRVSKLPPRFNSQLAQGACDMLTYAAIGHLLFATWAHSFYRMDADPFVYALLGTYLETFCKVWASAPAPVSTLFGAVPDTGEVARRLMQRNTAWATLTLCALVAALAGRALASGLRAALAVALPAVFISKRTAEGNPPFDVAVAGRQLAGPATYCVKELPEYAPAYVKVEWTHESD